MKIKEESTATRIQTFRYIVVCSKLHNLVKLNSTIDIVLLLPGPMVCEDVCENLRAFTRCTLL